MRIDRPVTFGVELGRHFDPEHLADEARQAERLGFDLLSISDHLHSDMPTYDPWTALAWVAAATSRLVVLPNVLGLPYRQPAVVAKMAETLDRLSAGRLVLGLGAGGYDAEFAAFGLTIRSPGEKVAALREAVQVIRGLWTDETVSFDGAHFRTDRARIEPKPSHRIPIWLGAYGPRSLALAGQVADGWIPSFPRLDLGEAVAMRARIQESARVAGRDPADITCACNVVVRFDSAATPSPRLLAGSSQAIAEQLAAIVDAGFTSPIAFLPDPDVRERFATEVLPLVRAGRSG